jgi:hypothetical protein
MHGHGPTRRRGARNQGVVTAPGAAIIAVPLVLPDDVVIDCPRHTRHFVLAGDGIALAAGLRLVNGRDAAPRRRRARGPTAGVGGCVLVAAASAAAANCSLASCTAERHGGGIAVNATGGGGSGGGSGAG